MYPLGTWFLSGIRVWIPCIKETMMMMMMMVVVVVVVVVMMMMMMIMMIIMMMMMMMIIIIIIIMGVLWLSFHYYLEIRNKERKSYDT